MLPVTVVVAMSALAARGERRMTGDLVEAARLARIGLDRIDSRSSWADRGLATSAVAEVVVMAGDYEAAHDMLDLHRHLSQRRLTF